MSIGKYNRFCFTVSLCVHQLHCVNMAEIWHHLSKSFHPVFVNLLSLKLPLCSFGESGAFGYNGLYSFGTYNAFIGQICLHCVFSKCPGKVYEKDIHKSGNPQARPVQRRWKYQQHTKKSFMLSILAQVAQFWWISLNLGFASTSYSKPGS